jgi:DNA-binding protein H-NS
MPSVAELLAQKAELEKMIADVQREEKSSAIAQVKALMSQYNLTLADLGGKSAPTGATRASGPRAGSKVAAKYRDPISGREWTGRGLKPNWLKAALAEGKSLDDFAL